MIAYNMYHFKWLKTGWYDMIWYYFDIMYNIAARRPNCVILEEIWKYKNSKTKQQKDKYQTKQYTDKDGQEGIVLMLYKTQEAKPMEIGSCSGGQCNQIQGS